MQDKHARELAAKAAIRKQLREFEETVEESDMRIDAVLETLKSSKMNSDEAAELRDKLLEANQRQRAQLKIKITEAADSLGKSNAQAACADPQELVRAFTDELI